MQLCTPCLIKYCIVPCCTVLYCVLLPCNVLHCVLVPYNVLYCALLYCTALYNTVLCYIALNSPINLIAAENIKIFKKNGRYDNMKENVRFVVYRRESYFGSSREMCNLFSLIRVRISFHQFLPSIIININRKKIKLLLFLSVQ